MRPRKILLATPPYHAGVLESAGIWPPLGLIYVAGALRQRTYEVEVYDSMSMQHRMDDVRAYLRSKEYDVLGISSITASIVAALQMAQISKEEHPAAVTVLGNVHPTFQYEELFDRHRSLIDFIVRGEGEITMPALMDALAGDGDVRAVDGIAYHLDGESIVTRPRKFVHDLNVLEPAWDLLDWNLYKFYVIPNSRMGIVNSSRGCPHGCSFCSQQRFWERSYRELDAARFIQQIQMLHRSYGVNVVMVSDEYPTKNRGRWEAILDMLIREDMDVSLLLETRVEDILRDRDILWKYRRAKILHVYVGVEATNQESLDIFKKDIRCEQSQESLALIGAHSMISECSFVLGMPEETLSSVAATLELAKHYNPDFAHFLAITPWPYSDLYGQLKGYIEEWDYSKYNLITPIVRPKSMTLDEVHAAMIDCYKDFYRWKAPQFMNDADPFRREYLLRATGLMMKNSFLQQYFRSHHGPRESPEAVLEAAI